MRKIIFLLVLFTLPLFTTACINNNAIKELNAAANDCMQKEDYKGAISALRSSVYLDPNIFESQYNLAVAYTENEDYDDAIETYKKAVALKPEAKDTYYSMAIMYENYAKDLYVGETKAQKEAELQELDENDFSRTKDGKYVPTEDEVKKVIEYYEESIINYAKYLELSPNDPEQSDIEKHIEELRGKISALESDSN